MTSARERRDLRDRRARRNPGGRRGPWYLLTGLILGLAFGLLFSLRISPVQYVDTAPEVLRQADKEQYRILIALAYQANGDLGRASERLANLHDSAPEAPLAELAQRMVADNNNIEIARALAQLASALVQPAGATPGSPQANSTPTAATTGAIGTPFSTLENAQAIHTATPQPSPTLPAPTVAPRVTLTPTLSTPFVLIDRQTVCDPAVEDGLIQVFVQDASGNPLPGVKITAAWQSGEENFYTGLTPKISLGYADFEMSEGFTYLVTAGEGGQQASGLTTSNCAAADGSRRLNGWKLVFALP